MEQEEATVPKTFEQKEATKRLIVVLEAAVGLNTIQKFTLDSGNC